MKKSFLFAALAACALTASAATDTFYAKDQADPEYPAKNVSSHDWTQQGSATGCDYHFRKVAISTYSNGADGYEYNYSLTASQSGTKGWICDAACPSGQVLRTIKVDFSQFSKYPSGELIVYGRNIPEQGLGANPWFFNAYTENGMDGVQELGRINKDNPELKVYENIYAFTVQAYKNNSNNALFSSISFEWGESRGDKPAEPEPQFHTWEISNMTILGGPYNSDNSDAYLRLHFNLTNNGTEAAAVQLTPRVHQGVDLLDFISMTTEEVAAGATIPVDYKNIQTTHIAGTLGTAATLTIDGDGSQIWEGPIMVCNYSPKFTLESAYDGKTGINPDAVNVPEDVTCTAGPYVGTFHCILYADAAHSEVLADAELLTQVKQDETANLTFDFNALGVNFAEETTYYYGLFRTRATGAVTTTPLGSGYMSFTTGKRQAEPEVQLDAPVINADIVAAAEYFVPAWAAVEGANNYQITVFVGQTEETVLTPYNKFFTDGETTITIPVKRTERDYCFKVRATDGENYSPYSELKQVTLPQPESVEAIELDNADTQVYDMQGRRVLNPANGMYIVVRNGKAMKTVIR